MEKNIDSKPINEKEEKKKDNRMPMNYHYFFHYLSIPLSILSCISQLGALKQASQWNLELFQRLPVLQSYLIVIELIAIAIFIGFFKYWTYSLWCLYIWFFTLILYRYELLQVEADTVPGFVGTIIAYILIGIYYYKRRGLWYGEKVVYKKEKRSPQEDVVTRTSSIKEKGRFDFAVVASITSCIYVLFLVFDSMIIMQDADWYLSWLVIFIIICVPLILFWQMQKRWKSILSVVNFFAMIFIMCVMILLLHEEDPYIFSTEATIVFSVLFVTTCVQFILAVIQLFKVNLNLYYGSIVYREKCYKKVEKMKSYYEKGIITEAEFKKNKQEIMKRIKER